MMVIPDGHTVEECCKCHQTRTVHVDQGEQRHVMSDEEWEAYIDGLIEAHKNGTCNPQTCAECLEPGDPLERWLS